jgi:glyoxylase-like metal-dependent hydrolase (beta-lactamase superfamily II)
LIPILPDLHLLPAFPRYAYNVYLAGDILIDSGTRRRRRRLMSQLRGRALTAHVVTHAHPDHQGCSRDVCDAFDIPLWCGADDADAIEDPGLILRDMAGSPVMSRLARATVGPPCPVSRRLREGDAVGSFTAIETPGHTPGHIALWRAADRVLILGDVAMSLGLCLTGPIASATPDPVANRASARRLAALDPAVVLFGHGPPLWRGRRFVEFARRLPFP